MKLTNILPFVAITTAFVVPDKALVNQLIESQDGDQTLSDRIPSKHAVLNAVKDVVQFSENAFDSAMEAAGYATDAAKSTVRHCYNSMTAFNGNAWLETAQDVIDDDLFAMDPDNEDKPRHPPHRRPHHRTPHHGHGKSNKTIFELIASSNYTTKLAKLISEYDDLVKTLNGTAANYTVFAPIDAAFEKLPKGHKPSKEVIKKILSYHVSGGFYPAPRILAAHTIPTTFEEKALGGEPQRLRISFRLFSGLRVNFYSKVVAPNIFGSNGVIHAVDSLLLPPPPVLDILELLPSEFSTLELALVKTGLAESISKANHTGGTFFAPSNIAFRKLGPKINAFLFSKYGEKYLKALLKYHVVANQTLYSDAFYKAKNVESQAEFDASAERPSKRHLHIDLPTLLDDKSLSVDIAQWGGFIQIKINGYTKVVVQDGLAKDGVIQVLTSVLIPPKNPGAAHYEEGQLTVEDLKERLEAAVEKDLGLEL